MKEINCLTRLEIFKILRDALIGGSVFEIGFKESTFLLGNFRELVHSRKNFVQFETVIPQKMDTIVDRTNN